ncbi:MAG: hypothetical protein N2512_14810 [Armatimonadetes bacterium]|nr:hypothetical protein [Armatimonadota bacterium]
MMCEEGELEWVGANEGEGEVEGADTRQAAADQLCGQGTAGTIEAWPEQDAAQ